MTAGRRAGTAALLALLAGGLALVMLPGDLGSVRLSGVGLLWWYGLVGTPAAVLLFGSLPAVRRAMPLAAVGPRDVTSWTSPAMLVGIAAQAFAGGHVAPLVVAVSVAAPCLAAARGAPVDRAGAVPALAAVGLVLWANLLVWADAARVAGGPRWAGLAVAAAVALAAGFRPALDRWHVSALAAGTSALLVALAALAAATGAAPWQAWSRLASRPALAFDAASPWVAEGRSVLEATTLVLGEPHRITARGSGVVRVLERDGDRAVVRDWSVAPGDALALRAGDEVRLEPGLSVRFEAGKRIPGAPASGAAWAAPRPHAGDGGLRPAGVAVTFLGGGLALLGAAGAAAGPSALAGPAAIAALAVGAACWGVYGRFAAPELALGAPGLAVLLGLPPRVAGSPWAEALVALLGAGMAALWVAAARTLAARAGDAARLLAPAGAGRLVFGGLVAAAAVGAAWPVAPWRALVLALGFAATTVLAPGLVEAGPGARLSGAALGAVAFALLALAGARAAGPLPAVVEFPALVAAPLAWGTTWVAGARRG